MIIDKIKSRDHLTTQEKYLTEYILDNPRDILKLNINELAKKSFTSTATVSRLCKKLGYKGYTEFKYEYAAEFQSLLEFVDDFDIEPFSSQSSINDALNTIENIHRRSVEYTKSLINKDVLSHISHFINECQFIEIYGMGVNYSFACMYCLIFEELGIVSNAYSSFNPMHVEYLKKRKKEDTLCIILTHTGQNIEMLKIAKQVYHSNARSIVICDNQNREICQYCDENIIMMTSKNTIELSNAIYISSLQYIFDVLASLKLMNDYVSIEKNARLSDQAKGE